MRDHRRCKRAIDHAVVNGLGGHREARLAYVFPVAERGLASPKDHVSPRDVVRSYSEFRCGCSGSGLQVARHGKSRSVMDQSLRMHR